MNNTLEFFGEKINVHPIFYKTNENIETNDLRKAQGWIIKNNTVFIEQILVYPFSIINKEIELLENLIEKEINRAKKHLYQAQQNLLLHAAYLHDKKTDKSTWEKVEELKKIKKKFTKNF